MSAPHPSFCLRYDDDGIGLAKRVAFEAACAATALEIAAAERDGRWALLVQDGEPLCRIARATGVWLITSPETEFPSRKNEDSTNGPNAEQIETAPHDQACSEKPRRLAAPAGQQL